MQTSLNPLLSNIITEDKLASSLTFGQFVKAIASFLAPYIAMWGATAAIPSLGLGWRVLFPVYMAIAIVAILLLGAASIKEEAPEGRPSTFAECIALLGNPFILLMFVGIMCHVGIDVGTNTTAPKILMERLGVDIHAAAFATSLYFIFRTIGCLTGSLVLAHWAAKKFFVVSVVLMVASMAGFLLFDSKVLLYVSIALVGYGNSNVFSILFSQALLSMPQRQNEVSGLMIMGLFGGTVFPLLMGFASDALHSQTGTLLVLVVGVFYLLFLFTKMTFAIEYLDEQLSHIRAGKANPKILDCVRVMYYGAPVPLTNVATVTVPDARTIMITPWEKKIIKDIEKGIMDSEVGITPENNGEVIRLGIPPLTEERRRLLAKQSKQEAETAKISIRNARRDAIEQLKKSIKTDGTPEDVEKDAEAEVQKVHDKYIKKVDELYAAKEKEIMTV